MLVKRYVKKPVEIKAAGPVDENNIIEIAQWSGGTQRGDSVYIATPEGEMRASPGDYVICGVAGEFYPCKPDIFEKTYRVVQ